MPHCLEIAENNSWKLPEDNWQLTRIQHLASAKLS